MAGVFQNIDSPPPSPPGECVPPPLVRGEDTLAGWRGVGVGGGVNILEDARHSSVLSVCKYFVRSAHPGRMARGCPALWCRPPPHHHRITWTFPWSGWWQPSLYTYSQLWSEKAIWKHILLVSALWKLYIKCCKNLSQLSCEHLKNFCIWILRFRSS